MLLQLLIQSQTQEDYAWALEQLREIFRAHDIMVPNAFVTDRDLALLRALESTFPTIPTLLCYWHVNKNVLTKARVYMPKVVDTEKSTESCVVTKDSEACSAFMTAWYHLVESETEDMLFERLESLRTKHRAVAEYCEYEWLDLYREKIVRAYTNKITHFGTVTTSKAEGCHAKVKRYLQTSRNDLFCFFRLMQNLWDAEHSEYESTKGQGIISRAFNTRDAVYDAVAYKIHRYALGQCQKSITSNETTTPCKGVYATIFGIPCRHTILERMAAATPLTIADFHPHWWLDRGQPIDIPEAGPGEPIPIPQRRRAARIPGRGLRGSGLRGTRREPSIFEIQGSSRSGLHHPQPGQEGSSWVWLEGTDIKRSKPTKEYNIPHRGSLRKLAKAHVMPARKPREEVEREILQESTALQLAQNTIIGVRSYMNTISSTTQALPTLDESVSPVYLSCASNSAESHSESENRDDLCQRPEGHSTELFTFRGSTQDEQTGGIRSTAEDAFCEVEVRNAEPHTTQKRVSVEQNDRLRMEAVEIARMIKSGGLARPLYEIEFGDLLQPRYRPTRDITIQRTSVPTPNPDKRCVNTLQRVQEDPGLPCLCSTKCDGRCGCQKDSKRCTPGCHSGKLKGSIIDHGNSFCCGNRRVTVDGKDLWPPGWTMVETFVGTDKAEICAIDKERLWNIYKDEPAGKLIESAGGVDSFLIREGYGREFGLLKRARANTHETGQSHGDCEVPSL